MILALVKRRSKIIFRRGVLIIAGTVMTTLSITACQTVADPHRDDFFSGFWNIVSGKYEEEQQKMEEELRKLEKEQAELNQQVSWLDNQHRQLQNELQKAKQRLTRLESGIRINRQQLKTEKESMERAKTEAEEIKCMLDRVKQTSISTNHLHDARDETRVIQQRLNSLRALVKEIAAI